MGSSTMMKSCQLWVGTVGGGLSVEQGGRFVTVGVQQGLANGVISQILEDGHGSIWLGFNAALIQVIGIPPNVGTLVAFHAE
jgi:ligand-binding sensor domain-containing protein